MKHYLMYHTTETNEFLYYTNNDKFEKVGEDKARLFESVEELHEQMWLFPEREGMEGWHQTEAGDLIYTAVVHECRGCNKAGSDVYEQSDAYGLSTGCWCDGCYNSDKYPYRKDNYFDPEYAGERMDDDY